MIQSGLIKMLRRQKIPYFPLNLFVVKNLKNFQILKFFNEMAYFLCFAANFANFFYNEQKAQNTL